MTAGSISFNDVAVTRLTHCGACAGKAFLYWDWDPVLDRAGDGLRQRPLHLWLQSRHRPLTQTKVNRLGKEGKTRDVF